jgi:hypothetical protein
MTAWPLAARAQAESKLRVIGILGDNAVAFKPWLASVAGRKDAASAPPRLRLNSCSTRSTLLSRMEALSPC